MIKINYNELQNHLYDENKYQLRNPYTEDCIAYPVETYRSDKTDEYIIYVRHKNDSAMIAFHVHCYTKEFAEECFNYILSIHLKDNLTNNTINLLMNSDYFVKYLSKKRLYILNISISPCLIVDNLINSRMDSDSTLTVKKFAKEDKLLINQFIQNDLSPRNHLAYYTSTDICIDNPDSRCAVFVAMMKDCVIGYLVSAPYNTGDYAEVQDIYISPDYRNKGYGTELATEYKNYITKCGYIPLYSDADNAASLKVALKAGFKFDHLDFVVQIKF